MIADVCWLACDEYYDTVKGEWTKIPGEAKIPTLYISTEQTEEEIVTMCLAFLSGVNEERILKGDYNALDKERERVEYAVEVIKNSKIHFDSMPDFTMKDVENTIKRSIRQYNIKTCFFDYIQSSVSILGEISRMSGGTKLREDNVLFLLSAKLKDLATQFNIFMFSSTQVNGKVLNCQ